MDAQADLSLRWAHRHIVGFVMRRLIYSTESMFITLKSLFDSIIFVCFYLFIIFIFFYFIFFFFFFLLSVCIEVEIVGFRIIELLSFSFYLYEPRHDKTNQSDQSLRCALNG